jgi:Flp pilus assembly protein TadD
MPDDPRVGEGIRLAHLAAETGENDPEALWMAGETMFMLAGEFERAQSSIDKSIALNPNSANAWNALGIVRANIGDAETALKHFAFARRLNPLRSFHHDFRVGISVAHFFAEHFEESVENAEAVLNDRPNYPRALIMKAASCGLLGRIDDGRKSVRSLLAIHPQLTIGQFKAIHEAPLRLNPRGMDNYCKGLRASGLPEG